PLPSSSRSVSSASLSSSSSSYSVTLVPDLRCGARWSRDYDVCVCHSDADFCEAQLLVSYLEAQEHNLRCFFQLRDSAPGGAISTELCQAIHRSHCWALLITSSFLLDPWCRYQMHQALAEAPMANGRIIPIMLQLPRSDYPKELRFYYFIDITAARERGYSLVHKAVLNYLVELCKKDSAARSSMSETAAAEGDSMDSERSLTDSRESSATLSTTQTHPTPVPRPVTDSEVIRMSELQRCQGKGPDSNASENGSTTVCCGERTESGDTLDIHI
ncbi:TIRAP protein, partial [Amia calva]|nr:TIRAP protein [Amia calva]